MSIRANLQLRAGQKAKLVAEAVTQIPLCWLAFPSPDDVVRAAASGCVITDRTDAIARSNDTLPFLATLFPELKTFSKHAETLLAALRKSRASQLELELYDHFDIAPDTFPNALVAAINAIDARDMSCCFDVPTRLVLSGGKTKTVKGPLLETTRDVLCYVTGVDPRMDDETHVGRQLIGSLW